MVSVSAGLFFTETVMVASPSATPVSAPSADTFAASSLLLVHTSWVSVVSAGASVAESGSV